MVTSLTHGKLNTQKCSKSITLRMLLSQLRDRKICNLFKSCGGQQLNKAHWRALNFAALSNTR